MEYRDSDGDLTIIARHFRGRLKTIVPKEQRNKAQGRQRIFARRILRPTLGKVQIKKSTQKGLSPDAALSGKGFKLNLSGHAPKAQRFSGKRVKLNFSGHAPKAQAFRASVSS